jgi:hypothetical protein
VYENLRILWEIIEVALQTFNMEDEPFDINLSDQEIFDLINDKSMWSDQIISDQQVSVEVNSG